MVRLTATDDRSRGNIRNIDHFVESLPDWSVLDGCFGGRIRPSDMDGYVERNDHFLYLEHKGAKGEIKTGQRRSFQALARKGDHVLCYWTNDPGKAHVTRIVAFEPRSGGLSREREIDGPCLERLRLYCRNWYTWANKTTKEQPDTDGAA